MTLDHRFQHADTLRSLLSAVIYPIRYLVNMPAEIGGWASDTFTTRRTLQEENLTLRTQNELLRADQQKLNFLKTENMRLRALLQSSKKFGEKVLIAELLTVDLDPYQRQVVINKGSRQGVYPGQPVVDANGVMGQIKHVGAFSSTALLLTDPNHAIPIMFNRNGLRAIAEGTGSDSTLELLHQPTNADIQVGDTLVTSGLGCVFPAGYPVGTVTEIKTDASLPFAQVFVKPSAHLNQNREVLLVWPDNAKTEDNLDACTAYRQAENRP